MYKFNLRSDIEISKDFNMLARIIKDASFDIVAMQEALSETAVKELIKILGSSWDYSWEAPRSVNSIAAEGYAYIWNKNKFSLISPSDSITENKYIKNPRIYNDYNTKLGKLVRNPYYARFKPKLGYFELRLINTHITFSSSTDDDTISGSDLIMRRREFEILLDIYRKLSEECNNSRPHYTLLLGDYNLNLKRFKSQYTIDEFSTITDRNGENKIIRTVQEELSTLKKNEPDEPSQNEDDYLSSNYDHFSYDIFKFKDITIESHRINTLSMYYNNNIKEHKRKVSDHLPIYASLDFNNKKSI